MADLSANLELAERWAPTLKILGDPTRLKLLTAIHFAGQYAYTVSELAEVTGLRVATVSAALRTLEQTGTLRSTREGRHIRYAIVDDTVHDLLHWIGTTHAYAHGDGDAHAHGAHAHEPGHDEGPAHEHGAPVQEPGHQHAHEHSHTH